MQTIFLRIVPLFFFFLASVSYAQDVHQELKETVRAEVLRILSTDTRDIVGTDAQTDVQDVQVRILEGERKGDVATFENDLIQVEVGDTIYINRLESIGGTTYYQFKDADRRTPLLVLSLLFAGALLLFAGVRGLRALFSLVVSVAVILFVLVPLLLRGVEPVFVCVAVAASLLLFALYVTHGFHAEATIAFLGTLGAVCATSVIAWVSVHASHLTGLSSDAAIYLNFSTKGTLDFGALLLGSIIIGILGVLDDVAITQAAVVAELKRANDTLRGKDLFVRSLRVGRAHITSLVNTLSFAYIGAALPLVLLMVASHSEPVLALNQEVVAVELIRILVGSLGLILAVPLTTLIAVWWYGRWGIDEHSKGVHHGHIH